MIPSEYHADASAIISETISMSMRLIFNILTLVFLVGAAISYVMPKEGFMTLQFLWHDIRNYFLLIYYFLSILFYFYLFYYYLIFYLIIFYFSLIYS